MVQTGMTTPAGDEFDFGPTPDNSQELNKLQQQNAELRVVIDTLQTNLRSAENTIKKYEPECSLFNVPSYMWSVNFNPGK